MNWARQSTGAGCGIILKHCAIVGDPLRVEEGGTFEDERPAIDCARAAQCTIELAAGGPSHGSRTFLYESGAGIVVCSNIVIDHPTSAATENKRVIIATAHLETGIGINGCNIDRIVDPVMSHRRGSHGEVQFARSTISKRKGSRA